MPDFAWPYGGICAIGGGQASASTLKPALDINASSERICAMPFGYHVGDSIPVFNTTFASGGAA